MKNKKSIGFVEIREDQYRFLTEALRDISKIGQKALDGDSNDAEHDALYNAVESANAILESLKS